MNSPDAVLIEAEALANAIDLAASCGIPEDWPESARLLLQDAARLAELHKQIVRAVGIGFHVVSRQRTEALGSAVN